jgi:hypothetical protein
MIFICCSVLSFMIHCYSILSVMLDLLHYTVLPHLLQHVFNYDKFFTTHCKLCYICNSTQSFMMHWYSILSVMIYLLQLTVNYDTSYSTLSFMVHCYSILSVMVCMLQLNVSYDTSLQHTVSYDTFVTAYCQLWYICHSTQSVTVHLTQHTIKYDTLT